MTDAQETNEEKSRRLFAERLGDWSDPDAIVIIRNGVPLDSSGTSVPEPTVVDIDDDGNLQMNDGTIRVP